MAIPLRKQLFHVKHQGLGYDGGTGNFRPKTHGIITLCKMEHRPIFWGNAQLAHRDPIRETLIPHFHINTLKCNSWQSYGINNWSTDCDMYPSDRELKEAWPLKYTHSHDHQTALNTHPLALSITKWRPNSRQIQKTWTSMHCKGLVWLFISYLYHHFPDVAATHNPTTNVMLLQQIIGRDKINRCLSKR